MGFADLHHHQFADLGFGSTATVPGTVTPTSPVSPGSGADGTGPVFYGWELLLAVVLVAIGLVAVWLLWRRNRSTAFGGLFTGVDNRRSTGKAIAVAWTVVVAWMVVSEALIAALPHPASFSELLRSASDLYFVLLGGPFAAAAFAKATAQSKITQGTLVKPAAANPSVSDLISDDTGNVDLYDFQYVLFNIIALLIVIFLFAANAGQGLPDIPPFLAILIGGSALTYTVNKATAASGPQIINVNPPKARIGDVITITGTQLFSATAGVALPAVTIGGISATHVDIVAGTAGTLTATVEDAPSGISLTKLTDPQDVVVTPSQASPVTAPRAITIVPDQPEITGVAPEPVKAGGQVKVAGFLLLAPGTPPGTADPSTDGVGGLTPNLTASGKNWPVTVEGPYDRDQVTLRVGAQPDGLGAPGTTADAILKLTRDAVEPPWKAVKYQIIPQPPAGDPPQEDPAAPPPG